MYNPALYGTLSYFSFCSYWVFSVSVFASLLCIPIGITSSEVGLKLCAVTEGIKNYDSIIKKKKKHQEIVLLAKSA